MRRGNDNKDRTLGAEAASNDSGSTEYLNTVLEHAPVALAVFDREMHCVFATHRWMKEYGGRDCSLRDTSQHEPFLEIPGRWRDICQRGLRGEVIFAQEDHLQWPDGTVQLVDWEVRPWFSNGELAGIILFTEDVTHRRWAATRFRNAIEAASVGMIMIDAAGVIATANREVEKLFGYAESELLGRRIEALVPEQYRGMHAAWREQYSLAPKPRRMGVGRDLAGLRKDGSQFWIEASISPVRTDEGVFTLAVISDITERKRAEVELRKSEERVRAILDATADGLVTIDAAGTIIDFNRAAERIFGYSANEIQGKNVRCLVPAGLRERYDEYFARFLQADTPRMASRTRNLIACRKSGDTIPIQLNVHQLADRGLYVGSVRDMSEQQALQEDVLRIASLEQRRIGQELHDATQQELIGLGLMAQSLVERLRQRSDTETLAMAERLAKGIEEANLNVQVLARGLVPTTIDRRSLMSALAELVSNVQSRSGLNCRFECSQPVFFDSDETSTHLFRIAQEAINNATKHAQAKSLVIRLKRSDTDVILQVIDDGVGIHPERTATVGVGLRLMAYRSALIGGVLAVKPNTGGGTTVTCTVPRIGHDPKSVH